MAIEGHALFISHRTADITTFHSCNFIDTDYGLYYFQLISFLCFSTICLEFSESSLEQWIVLFPVKASGHCSCASGLSTGCGFTLWSICSIARENEEQPTVLWVFQLLKPQLHPSVFSTCYLTVYQQSRRMWRWHTLRPSWLSTCRGEWWRCQ